MVNKTQLLEEIKDAVVVGDRDKTIKLVEEALKGDTIPPQEILTDGLGVGMTESGDKYERKEYFVPEVLMSVDAMYGAMDILMPRIKALASSKGKESPGKVVIGVVEGDIHDIGKSIVKALLEAAGFEVHDLGRDVPSSEFVRVAKEVGAQVIAASTLMTPTLEMMEQLEGELKEEGLKGQIKTMIGGGATSKDFADSIGADAYVKDAVEGVDAIKRMVNEIKAATAALKKSME